MVGSLSNSGTRQVTVPASKGPITTAIRIRFDYEESDLNYDSAAMLLKARRAQMTFFFPIFCDLGCKKNFLD